MDYWGRHATCLSHLSQGCCHVCPHKRSCSENVRYEDASAWLLADPGRAQVNKLNYFELPMFNAPGPLEDTSFEDPAFSSQLEECTVWIFV